MKIMLMSMSTLLSVSFTQMNHPFAMWLILLIEAVLISLITCMLSQTFRFSYVLFLIFLIYVTSLASNQMFFLSTKIILSSLPIMMLSMSIITFCIFKSSIIQNQEMIYFMSTNNFLINSLVKLYNQPTATITILLASYLFLTLMAMVKITNIFKGQLWQMN